MCILESRIHNEDDLTLYVNPLEGVMRQATLLWIADARHEVSESRKLNR